MGSDILVSYHDNDHYNSVRNKLNPPKPTRVAIPSNAQSGAKSKSNGHKSRGQSEIENVTTTLSKSYINEKKNVVAAMQENVKRSAPCPCGSGSRYKKCCLAKQKEAKRMDRIKGKREEDEEEGISEGSEGGRETQEMFRVVAI